jgi:hypothetical protein
MIPDCLYCLETISLYRVSRGIFLDNPANPIRTHSITGSGSGKKVRTISYTVRRLSGLVASIDAIGLLLVWV